MLYNSIKFAHILSATVVIGSMAYCYHLWYLRSSELLEKIQLHTWLVILPFAIIQLLTGFTMISLKHEDLTQLWIKGSTIGFIIALASWFGFVCLLLSKQQFKRLERSSLLICGAALLSMIFFMANKI